MISYELELKMIESSEYIQDPCKSIQVLSRQCSLLTLQRREKMKSKLVLKKHSLFRNYKIFSGRMSSGYY